MAIRRPPDPRARSRVAHPRRDAVPRALHPPGHGGRARPSSARSCARSSGSSTASAASTRRPSRAGRATRSRSWPWPLVAIVAGYVVLRLQDVLPLNQARHPGHVARPRVQHVGQLRDQHELAELLGRDRRDATSPRRRVLAVRNFTSAATGLAVAIALFRGLTRRSAKTLGNYWVDLTRGVLYILLPISIVGALVLVWQGVPQTWDGRHRPSRPSQGAQQTIAIGPIASQEWIKELGNNGGGFLNANSAHPFENPTPLTNWLEMFAHPAVPVLADLHVRPVRRQPAPGLDDLRRDGGHPARRRRSSR